MVSNDVDDPILNEESDAPDDAVDDSHSNKRKRGKVPKKVLKAERERLKREQLNELFNTLASVLELNQENNGKASVLNETIRLLKDTVSHIQILRKENETLLSESHYHDVQYAQMTAEKNELKEETTALEVQIKKIQNDLEEKLGQSKPDLNVSPREIWQREIPAHFMEGHFPQRPTTDASLQQQPILGPVYVIPINPDLQTFQNGDVTPNQPVSVRKPHARYPTPADAWPLQLLSKQAETTIRQTAL